jgi:8-amino-7-oxononanoate synthase
MDVNESRGDALRADISAKTARVLECLERVGAATPNRSGFPVIEIPIAHHEQIAEVGRMLFDRGIYVTMAVYPLVPRDEVGVRVQVTAANSDSEVDRLILALTDLAERGLLQSRSGADQRAA